MNKKKIVLLLLGVVLLTIPIFQTIIVLSPDGHFTSSKIYTSKQGFGFCETNNISEIASTNKFGITFLVPSISTCETVITVDKSIAVGKNFRDFYNIGPLTIVKKNNWYERPIAVLVYSLPSFEQNYDLLSSTEDLNYNNPHKSDFYILPENTKVQDYDFTIYKTRRILFAGDGGIQPLENSLKREDYCRSTAIQEV